MLSRRQMTQQKGFRGHGCAAVGLGTGGVWPGGRGCKYEQNQRRCGLRLWMGPHEGQGEGARQTKAQMVHDKRSMTKRTILLGHRACSERS